jgi:hypothetical protein
MGGVDWGFGGRWGSRIVWRRGVEMKRGGGRQTHPAYVEGVDWVLVGAGGAGSFGEEELR